VPDQTNDPGMAARAADSLTDARYAVETATDEVLRTSRRVRAAVEGPGLPRAVLGFVQDITRIAPLAMLSVAFLAGAMLTSRQRRY